MRMSEWLLIFVKLLASFFLRVIVHNYSYLMCTSLRHIVVSVASCLALFFTWYCEGNKSLNDLLFPSMKLFNGDR